MTKYTRICATAELYFIYKDVMWCRQYCIPHCRDNNKNLLKQSCINEVVTIMID